ncbi:MAG: tetratricopeptide repeat protein [Lachnospiraceae bacterium]|nr:tetratricopeptide repeat protein [Lachnospiraceae bacterium]
MKCSNCGKEIRVGSVYCEHCGKEAMIVSDYNVLEDEVLQSLLEDDDAFAKRQAALKRKQEEIDKQNALKENDEPNITGNFFLDKIWNIKKNRIIFIIACVVLVLFIAAIIFFTSFRFKMIQGSNLDSKAKYDSAIEVYKEALEKRKDSVEARVALGKDYIITEQYDKAEEILLEALNLDKESIDVYKALIVLYTATNDTEKLQELENNAPNSTIKKLFDTTVVTAPKASVKGGKYGEDQEVKLVCDDDSTIYYTLDGTTPDKVSGKLYSGPIKIEGGNTTLKAIAYNKDAEKSIVTTEKYQIDYEAPDYPTVSPGSGHYDTPTTIRITTGVEGAKIFYTWDGSIPTPSSEMYYGPIDIPEGNNVLSVIVVDKHGMSSNVFRANYEYTP